MEILHKGNVNISKIISTNVVKEEKCYKRTAYSMMKSVKGRFFLWHSLLGRVYELSEQEWEFITKLEEKSISGKEIKNSGMDWLVKDGVFFSENGEEYEIYSTVRMILENTKKKEEGIGTYVILPTMACNARCIYCYEENMEKPSMTDETVERIVEYILRTRKKGEIKLRWFGGEPLVAHEQITRICQELTQAGVSFHSSMISNGVLITKKMACEAKKTWHLNEIQISVDGARQDYEARKCFCDPVIHNYEVLMTSIQIFMDADIKVSLRCNLDADNFSRLRDFVDDLYGRFGNSPNLKLYFAMLFQTYEDEGSAELYGKVLNLYRYMEKKGIPYGNRAGKKWQFRTNHCMADSGNSVVIDPRGDLYHCEHLHKEDSFGAVSDRECHLRNKTLAVEVDEKCKKCPFLPICTPFYKRHCPDYNEKCREFLELDFELALEGL